MAVTHEMTVDQIKTFKEFLASYNKLSEVCFVDCINDFTSRTLKPFEDRCATNCTEKFIKMNQRISQRFQDFQIASSDSIAASQKK